VHSVVDGATIGEGVLRDITEQVLATRRREELEHQLHQAERLDSLGQLAGGIAHDFNNLLGVISGYVRFVLDDLGENHPSRPDIENIDHAASRAAALTRQLLIFSRLQPSQPEIVDLGSVVAEIERLLRRTIGEDIDFRIEARPELPPVFIDRSRLEQIVMNLVVNARAAMPGGGRLILATGLVDGHVFLTVSDTGCGMTEEVKRRAFEPFFTTRGRGQGSGLGLSTVYGAVTEASGTITLESRVGEGTSITVRLPAAAHAAIEPPSGDDDEPHLRGDGERILIVEDDDGIRQIVCRILSNAGYSVLDTGVRTEALELIRDPGQGFDLLLSDVVMPGMAVTEFLDAVRDSRPFMPILLMSGYTADQTANSRPLPDDIPLITKPFKLDTLLRRVKAVMDTRRAHASARR
jgi:two-component system cell cycle sensor histidine kinase/response regulator CckA